MQITEERRHLYRVLDETTLPPNVAEKLAGLGITTLDELRDYWNYGNRQLITAYLGDSPLRLVTASPTAMLAMRSAGRGPSPVVNLLEAGRSRPLVRHPRGVILSARQRAEVATAPAAAVPATRRAAATARPTVSLVKHFPAVRHQRDRGTCVAFASIAFLEFQRQQNSGDAARRHSEQFVYWGCKQDDGMKTTEGTFVSTARKVLKARGACFHTTWKYHPYPVPHNESQGPPPAGAKKEAKQFTWGTGKVVAARKVDRLRLPLDAGRPVVLSVKTFPSWDFGTTAETGDMTMPFPGELSDGGHAVCLVGYQLDAAAPGGGRLIFRNSWGKTWANKSQTAAGYGTLPFEYVKKYGLEAFA